MSDTAELDLLIETRERESALLEAKDAAAKGGPKAQEKYRQAKDDVREHRRKWREVRAAFTAPSDDTARPATAGLKARSK